MQPIKAISYFGRPNVPLVLSLKPTMPSRLLKTMLAVKLLEPISGKGKGKYRFVQF